MTASRTTLAVRASGVGPGNAFSRPTNTSSEPTRPRPRQRLHLDCQPGTSSSPTGGGTFAGNTKHHCATPGHLPRVAQQHSIEIMKKNINAAPAANNQDDEDRAARSFATQTRMGDELLNQLGYSEHKTDLMLWMNLSCRAALNQMVEVRHLDVDGNSPTRDIQLTVRVPNGEVLEALLTEAAAELPNLLVHSVETLAEVIDDRRVRFRGMCELSAPVLTEITTKLIVMVDPHGGSLEELATVDSIEDRTSGVVPTNLTRCYAKDLTGEWRAPDAPHRFKMRCEFLSDALLLRLALAPWVLTWREVELDAPLDPATGARLKMTGMDRSIEFEVTDNAPKLDHLRWLLSKVTDMHVAAESLNYAERYTGERLPYDMVERMVPPEDVVEEMTTRLRSIAEVTPDLVDRLEDALAGC